MDGDTILNPVRLLHRRTLYLTDGKLRCPLGHQIKHRPIIGVWAGLTCVYTPPPNGRACGGSGYFAQGLDGVFVIEATTRELLHLQLKRLTFRDALLWLNVEAPTGFRTVEDGRITALAS